MSATYHVKDFGALPGTSCGAQIQAAIDAAGADIGSSLVFDAGEYRTSIPLVQPYHGLRIFGRGTGWGANGVDGYLTRGATLIKATAEMGQLFTMQPDMNPVSGLRLGNASVWGICFDAALLANFCFVMKSAVACDVDRVSALRPRMYGFWFGVVPDGHLPKTGVSGAIYTEPRDLQHNRFGKLMADVRANAAYGFYTHGDDIANPSLNDFEDVTYWHKNGFGFYFDHGDSNTIGKVTGYRQPGGTGIGFAWGAGTSTADYARSNSIGFSQFGPGGCVAYSSALPSVKNKIQHYDTDNGTPLPTVQVGATMEWDTV